MSESASRLPLELPGSGSARLFGDDSLARRAAGGDQRAFAAIYRRHHQELYRYCRAILGDPDDAQDALQATMVKALRSLPGEQREIALKPWLFRIAHNEAISIVRARHAASELDPEQPDPLPAVEQQAAARARLRELVCDLDDLPERQRGSLVMRELSGLSFEEIGRVFAVGPAAAKQAVYEARVALQEIAEGREMECGPVREAISAHDRRVLRGRRIRAHLRGCEGCSDFEAAIGRRRSDLAAIAPPLALPAALATLQAVLGGGSTGGGAVAAGAGATAAGAGALGGGLGAGLGGGAAVKAAIAVVAAATVAGGAAELSGVVDLGGSPSKLIKEQAAPPATNAPESSPSAQPSSRPAPVESAGSGSGERGHSGDAGSANGRRHGQGRGNSGGAGRSDEAHGNSAGQGQASAPGQAATPGNSPAAPPGQAGTAPGQAGTAPGQAGPAPGQSGSAGSQASATGQTHSSSAGSQASATGQAHGGGPATAPGQTDTAPGQSGTAGNSADAPDYVK